MKIAVIGDAHLGKAQKGIAERENDIYDLFLRICKRIKDERAEIACFLGDLFDSSHPPIKSISVALQGLEIFAVNNIKVILIAGNHDIPSIKSRMCPLELPKNINNDVFELSSENFIYSFNSNGTIVNICGINYHPPEKRQLLISALEKISLSVKKICDKNSKNLNILLLHQGIKEFSPNEGEISINEIPDIFDFVFVGHLHLRREYIRGKTKIILPGSIEIGSVEEVVKQMHNNAHIIMVDTETRLAKKIEIELSRIFIQKKISSSAIDYELKKLSEELEDAAKRKSGNLPCVYLDIEDDAKIGNSLINEKIARTIEKKALFVQKNISSEEINEENKPDILFKEINLKDIIKKNFQNYDDEISDKIYELYKERKDIESAKLVIDKIYEKFKDIYEKSHL